MEKSIRELNNFFFRYTADELKLKNSLDKSLASLLDAQFRLTLSVTLTGVAVGAGGSGAKSRNPIGTPTILNFFCVVCVRWLVWLQVIRLSRKNNLLRNLVFEAIVVKRRWWWQQDGNGFFFRCKLSFATRRTTWCEFSFRLILHSLQSTSGTIHGNLIFSWSEFI